jgi:Xaa-Pro dipeptidase
MTRIQRLREKLHLTALNGYLITNIQNIYYLTEFLDVPNPYLALFVPLQADPILFTPPLSYAAAQESAQNCTIQKVTHQDAVIKLITALEGHQTIGFDNLSIPLYLLLGSKLPSSAFTHQQDIISTLRRIKDDQEIALIRRAAELTDQGAIAGCEFVSEGVKEYEVAAEIEYAMRRRGSEGVAFETVVASGPRAAFPHGLATDRVLKRGDAVVMDLGAVVSGYRCDITRTVIVGPPSKQQETILYIVMEAHDRALDAMQSGVPSREIDALARQYITQQGFGEKFIHSLGHGVGLDVHEPPFLSAHSSDILEEGNIVTDEPGIYLSTFGARIEDTVLINSDTAEKLTIAPYYLP